MPKLQHGLKELAAAVGTGHEMVTWRAWHTG